MWSWWAAGPARREEDAAGWVEGLSKGVEEGAEACVAVEGGGDAEGVEADEGRDPGQAAVVGGPGQRDGGPVLDEHGEELTEDLAGDALRCSRAGAGEAAVLLPELEEQFDLPAQASEDAGLVDDEALGRQLGDQEGPVSAGERVVADGLPASVGLGDLGRDAHGQQPGGLALVGAESDGDVDRRHRPRGLAGDPVHEVQAPASRIEDGRLRLAVPQPVDPGLGQRTEVPQAEVPPRSARKRAAAAARPALVAGVLAFPQPGQAAANSAGNATVILSWTHTSAKRSGIGIATGSAVTSRCIAATSTCCRWVAANCVNR